MTRKEFLNRRHRWNIWASVLAGIGLLCMQATAALLHLFGGKSSEPLCQILLVLIVMAPPVLLFIIGIKFIQKRVQLDCPKCHIFLLKNKLESPFTLATGKCQSCGATIWEKEESEVCNLATTDYLHIEPLKRLETAYRKTGLITGVVLVSSFMLGVSIDAMQDAALLPVFSGSKLVYLLASAAFCFGIPPFYYLLSFHAFERQIKISGPHCPCCRAPLIRPVLQLAVETGHCCECGNQIVTPQPPAAFGAGSGKLSG